jgi:hypothetical protein
MRLCSGLIAAVSAACLLTVPLLAQEPAAPRRTSNAPPKPSGPTPRTADGHPDLTGVWNGIGDNLLRRSGSNKPIYKPEYWEMVKYNDHNSNEEDPSNNCMPAGVPRAAIPSYISQHPGHLMFIYPGQGGLIATQTMYRMVPIDGRTHTPLQELDGSYTGESIGSWDGDTLVVDSWGFNTNTWFDQIGGYFHGENMHVIERFRRDGNTLTWTATVEDPDFLLEPWTTTPRVALLNPRPNTMGESQPCSERDLSHLVTKEHH